MFCWEKVQRNHYCHQTELKFKLQKFPGPKNNRRYLLHNSGLSSHIVSNWLCFTQIGLRIRIIGESKTNWDSNSYQVTYNIKSKVYNYFSLLWNIHKTALKLQTSNQNLWRVFMNSSCPSNLFTCYPIWTLTGLKFSTLIFPSYKTKSINFGYRSTFRLPLLKIICQKKGLKIS